MSESVFFSVPFLNPFGNFPFFSLILAFFLSVIFCFFLFRQKFSPKIPQNFPTKKDEQYFFPNISDKNFLEKIFLLLQKFAFNNFFPKNSYSHSTSDIAKYCHDKNFLQLYQNVENLLFEGKILTKEEQEKILHSAQEIIYNHQK